MYVGPQEKRSGAQKLSAHAEEQRLGNLERSQTYAHAG